MQDSDWFHNCNCVVFVDSDSMVSAGCTFCKTQCNVEGGLFHFLVLLWYYRGYGCMYCFLISLFVILLLTAAKKKKNIHSEPVNIVFI